MSQVAESLKTMLLGLPVGDRAELAYCLIRSLDEDEGFELPSAWGAELERRWQEMEEGKVVGEPAEQVLSELRNKYP